MKKILILSLAFVALLVAAVPSQAAIVERGDEFAYKLQVPFPSAFDTDGGGDSVVTTTRGVAELTIQLFGFAIAMAGLLAMAMLVYAGFRWATSAGNASAVGDAKQRMTDAVLGLLLIGTAWVILRTINPSFLLIQEPILNIKFDVDGCPIQIRTGAAHTDYKCREEAEQIRQAAQQQSSDDGFIATELNKISELIQDGIIDSCEQLAEHACINFILGGGTCYDYINQSDARERLLEQACGLANNHPDFMLDTSTARCGYINEGSGFGETWSCLPASKAGGINQCEDVIRSGKSSSATQVARDACLTASADLHQGDDLFCQYFVSPDNSVASCKTVDKFNANGEEVVTHAPGTGKPTLHSSVVIPADGNVKRGDNVLIELILEGTPQLVVYDSPLNKFNSLSYCSNAVGDTCPAGILLDFGTDIEWPQSSVIEITVCNDARCTPENTSTFKYTFNVSN